MSADFPGALEAAAGADACGCGAAGGDVDVDVDVLPTLTATGTAGCPVRDCRHQRKIPNAAITIARASKLHGNSRSESRRKSLRGPWTSRIRGSCKSGNSS